MTSLVRIKTANLCQNSLKLVGSGTVYLTKTVKYTHTRIYIIYYKMIQNIYLYII